MPALNMGRSELPCIKVSFKNDVDQKMIMSYQEDSFRTEGEQKSQQRFQMIDTLKAPIIEMGRNLGYEVLENYDLGAGPIHVCWTFKPGSESLPDIRLGFICMTKKISDSIESMPDKSILQLRKYVTVLTPSTLVSKTGVKGARERDSTETGEVL